MAMCAVRRPKLQKLFSAFPDGWPGLGLFVLRLAVVMNLIGRSVCAFTASNRAGWSVWALELSAVVVGLLIMVGFLTPFASLAATLGYLVDSAALFLAIDANGHTNAFRALDLAVMSFTLVLLGPGSVSVDARLFGHREIIIPEGRRPRR